MWYIYHDRHSNITEAPSLYKTHYFPVLCSSGPWCSACSSSSTWQTAPLGTPGNFLFSCTHPMTIQEDNNINHWHHLYFNSHHLLLFEAKTQNLPIIMAVPEKGRSLGAQCGLRDPTPLVVGLSPGQGTHLSLPAGHLCPLPCRPRHGRSGPQRRIEDC